MLLTRARARVRKLFALNFLHRLINHTGIQRDTLYAVCTRSPPRDAVLILLHIYWRPANQRRDADETQKLVTLRSQRIAEEQKECKRLEEIARADLATVEPALNEAIKVFNYFFLSKEF